MAGRMVRSCVQTALKAANSVVGLAGMAVILYALWMLRAWYREVAQLHQRLPVPWSATARSSCFNQQISVPVLACFCSSAPSLSLSLSRALRGVEAPNDFICSQLSWPPPLLFAALADPSSVALRNAFDFGQQNSITVPLFHSFTGAFGCSTNQLRVPCGSERLRKWRAKRTLLGLHRNTLVAFSFFFFFLLWQF
jgi:hypothetical protein